MPCCVAVSLKEAVFAARHPLSDPVWMNPTVISLKVFAAPAALGAALGAAALASALGAAALGAALGAAALGDGDAPDEQAPTRAPTTNAIAIRGKVRDFVIVGSPCVCLLRYGRLGELARKGQRLHRADAVLRQPTAEAVWVDALQSVPDTIGTSSKMAVLDPVLG